MRLRSVGASGGGDGERAPLSVPSPRSEDRVLAVVDDGDAETVEGILHIRHIPSPVRPGGRDRRRPVAVHSPRLDKGRPARRSAGARARGPRPVVGGDGWRRIVDIDQARDEGLLLPQTERTGGTWDDLFAALQE